VECTPARRCVRKTKLRVVGGMSTCRADWLLGLPLYHISRHVASTFKRLATTTTHCVLNNLYQNRQGKPPGHDTTHDPVHHPYTDCRIVITQLLYRASDRKSLDFYRSYLAEHLSVKDSGTIHRIPKILLLGFIRLPTEGYTQGGRFWVGMRRDQELEGADNTRFR
jgi:hypothetical protein